ncbi:MAG TPA: MFS transporter [Ktedonobacteraceae bacterium]|nr:MFS transporter [Ktedonobacteraceae bacterium]
MDKTKRLGLLLMALTILIDFTGFGLILPMLAFWAQHLGANAIGVGLMITIYALAQFVFTPVLGTISDRYGRKPVICVSLLIEAVGLGLTALAGSLPLLLIARFIGGLGASNIGSAQAVVSDVTTAEERAKGMGLIGAAIGLGFVLGPILGGALVLFGATVPFWTAAVVALVNALLVIILLPETRNRIDVRQERERAVVVGKQKANFLFAGWRNAWRNPAVAQFVLVNLFYTIAFTAMEAVFPLFSQHTFKWGAIQNGYVFTYVGVIVVIMQGGLVGRLVKRWNEQKVMITGVIMLAAGLLLLAFSSQLAWLLVSLGIVSAGDGAVSPTISTLLSFASPSDTQGETLGLAQGVGGLGRVIGPVAAGSIYAWGGPGAPFIAGGILVVLAALIALPALFSVQKPAEVCAVHEEGMGGKVHKSAKML